MKLLVVLCLVALVAAKPPPKIPNTYGDVRLLKYENDNVGFGNYKYGFEQTDGTKVQQYGEIKNEGREDEFLAVSGSFQWVGSNGIVYTVRYTADKEGYQPEIEEGPGAAPPVDPNILLSLLN